MHVSGEIAAENDGVLQRNMRAGPLGESNCDDAETFSQTGSSVD